MPSWSNIPQYFSTWKNKGRLRIPKNTHFLILPKAYREGPDVTSQLLHKETLILSVKFVSFGGKFCKTGSPTSKQTPNFMYQTIWTTKFLSSWNQLFFFLSSQKHHVLYVIDLLSMDITFWLSSCWSLSNNPSLLKSPEVFSLVILRQDQNPLIFLIF